MRPLFTTLAFIAFGAALSWKAAQPRSETEQREAVFAIDGESADDARDRIEACTSSEFGFCHPFPR